MKLLAHPAPVACNPPLPLFRPKQVFETDNGTLRNVLAAIKRGRLMKCAHCGRRGATVGCRVPSCNCRQAIRMLPACCSRAAAFQDILVQHDAAACAFGWLSRCCFPEANATTRPPTPPLPSPALLPCRSYHVACAKDAACTYYCDQFQIACPAHARLFREESQQQCR